MNRTIRPSEARRNRDIRLDFFRGLALFIITISHAPMNAWGAYTPGRFGFSDSAEIFVFCSGLASALAFGRLYDERGIGLCLARIALRCWQVYWAHIGVFFSVLALMIGVDLWLGTGDSFVRGLDLHHFVSGDTGRNLLGLMTLTYVPGLFDILPLYIVLLAMVPLVLTLSRLGPPFVLVFLALVWAVGNARLVVIPAEPWSERAWFFNPLAWQLVFFTGFALARGWLPAPPVGRRAVVAAIALLVLMVPIAYDPLAHALPHGRAIRGALLPYYDKSSFGLLRYFHFLLLAYVAFALAGPQGAGLTRWGNPVWQTILRLVTLVGSHALPTFLAGVVLSVSIGVAFNLLGQSALATVLINLTAIAALIGVAHVTAWFKTAPWERPRIATALGRDRGGEIADPTQPRPETPLTA